MKISEDFKKKLIRFNSYLLSITEDGLIWNMSIYDFDEIDYSDGPYSANNYHQKRRNHHHNSDWLYRENLTITRRCSNPSHCYYSNQQHPQSSIKTWALVSVSPLASPTAPAH